MKFNLVALGCAFLLTLGLASVSFAGSITDADNDGVPDAFDTCKVVANGPLIAGPGTCPGQQDSEPDGYGIQCDPDLNNNNIVDLGDLGVLLPKLGSTAPLDLVFIDLNCNGIVDLGDLGIILPQLGQLMAGRSDQACAGTIPCITP